ncbi:LLM class flavin-dependent oxidoreductase [Cellulomonas taurus]|uniref:LLM class flavin-dependent oxidoreductase n=1 Tax=Cellulomonas taurus TaxID=2729175 RepID=UPI001FE6F7D1|nr:LLM class flavin-dependent oxidoreductase [Cellulomonas taurus]
MSDLGLPLRLGVLLSADVATDPGARALAAERDRLDLVAIRAEVATPHEPRPCEPGAAADRGRHSAPEVGTPPGSPRRELPTSAAAGAAGAAGAGEDAAAGGDDPWTVGAWVAAVTSDIRLMVAVDGIDRPATVTARAVASLDHLAGGRVDLVLTGDDPTVLGEAVAAVRGMWATADRTPLYLDGTRHRAEGAQRGPAPAHTPVLGILATGPTTGTGTRSATVAETAAGSGAATLALAAREADLWWALGDDDADALAAAATEAGRSPAEIGILRTVSPEQSAEDLAALVLTGRASTLLLDGDDPDWATTVAPRVRELVAAGRERAGTRVHHPRSAAVRAARRPGIDYDGLPADLAADAVEPGDAAYATVRSGYMRGGSPGLVLRPADTAGVVAALAWARTQDVPLAIRSGGHGISGRSTNDGGIVLDLGRLNRIEVLDTDQRLVRVGPGARWGEVARALAPHGWAITSGDSGGVGVGGLATAGGIGFLVREHGLTLDHLRAAEVVLADGTVLRASAEENPDLFWGVRGAGANLGIVTSFEFVADPVTDVGFAQLVFDATDLETFLVDYGALVEASPRDVTPFVLMGRPQGGRIYAQVMAMVDSTDPDVVIDRLQPFAQLAPLVQQQVQLLPYSAVVVAPDELHQGEGEPVTRSGMVDHLTPDFARDAAALVRSGHTYFFQIRAAGGAVADVPEDATAYAHRSANFSVVAFGPSRHRLDAIWDAMAGHFSGIYSSFETDRRPERLVEVFPEPTLTRLRALKRRYDPSDVFRHNFSVAATSD